MNRKTRSVSHKPRPAASTASSAGPGRRKAAETADDAESGDVFRSLRSDIVNGSLKAGSRLRFIELQARYGIGTSPIREALSRLAADRLVIQEVNRGFSVPPLSLEDFADITALRLSLERAAIRASIARGGEAWEEALVLAHHRLRRLGRPESDPEDESIPEEWERRHRAFHMALIAACQSPWTLHFCGVLYDQFDRYRRRAGRDAATQAGLSRQHDQLAEAAIAHDGERADSILEDHINTTARMVARRLGSRVEADRRAVNA
jgi:DNA-binding GntR family transcriptional regulator